MVSVVASSDYLTSVNYVTAYGTREYAACNEAIVTEYPLLQGSWDFEEIDYAFKLLNDSKLEDLDPKYIQKQAKKATGFEARSSDLAELEIQLQEAIAYGQRQREKLDAMVMVYNRTVRKGVSFRVTPAESLSTVLASYEISRKYKSQHSWGQTEIFTLAIVAQITGKPVLLYRAGFPKAALVETPKHCFCGPIRVGSLSVRHMGRTFNTLQEWRAYYEPIIARLDSPVASA